MTDHTQPLPLILDAQAKCIGYYRSDRGRVSRLLCKAGRYYILPSASMRTFRVGRDDAAAHYLPLEDGTVN